MLVSSSLWFPRQGDPPPLLGGVTLEGEEACNWWYRIAKNKAQKDYTEALLQAGINDHVLLQQYWDDQIPAEWVIEFETREDGRFYQFPIDERTLAQELTETIYLGFEHENLLTFLTQAKQPSVPLSDS